MLRSLAVFTLLMCTAAPVANAATYRRTVQRIPGRYIVMFNDHVQAADVDRVAISIARQHGGKLLGTMKHAMRGFGIRLSEAQARALLFHPFVAQIEEDGYVTLSADTARPAFDFRAVRRPESPSRTLTPRADSATACPWNTNGYFVCEYPNDDFWFLDRIDNAGLLYAYKAYGYNSMGTGVRAYVVDSGVWFGHTEFDTRVEAGANMTVDPDVNDPAGGVDHTGAPEPDNEEPPITPDYWPANDPCNFNHPDPNIHGNVRHGTAVASLIGGNTRGVAKNVTIVPVKVFSCEDGLSSQLALARGLDWIQNDMTERPGPRALVNISMFFESNPNVIFPGHTVSDGQELCEDGQGGFTNCMSAVEHEVNELVRKNIPVITSANNQNNGNCTTSPARLGYGGTFPTNYHTITVGATSFTNTNGTYTDTKLGISNFGPCVSMWAPGGPVNVATQGVNRESAFMASTGGSSFASAIVSGAVARLLQQYPTLTAAQVWTELENRTAQRSVQPPDFDPSAVTNRRLLYIRATE